MFTPQDRGQSRAVFFRAWRRYRERLPLEGVEKLVVAVALKHPEYHAVLDHPETYAERDYLADTGETNPFLHMAMHLAIEEQLSVDQPGGVRNLYQRLLQTMPDEHETQHCMMECLAEMLWQAGRDRTAPSENIYFDCLKRRVEGKPGRD